MPSVRPCAKRGQRHTDNAPPKPDSHRDLWHAAGLVEAWAEGAGWSAITGERLVARVQWRTCLCSVQCRYLCVLLGWLMVLCMRAEDCNLDDGDISRLLSRTTDLLRQVLSGTTAFLSAANALCSMFPVPTVKVTTCTADRALYESLSVQCCCRGVCR